MDSKRASCALIHTENLKFNLGLIRRSIPAGTQLCAAVKAGAYGHGALEISRLLREENVEVLGVSNPIEGAEIRKAGDRGRILLFGPTVPEEAAVTVDAGLETMAGDNEYLQSLERAAAVGSKTVVPVHLKVDTGMHRIGCRPEDALDLARRISNSPYLRFAGLATHFPSADSDLLDDLDFTRRQIRQLNQVSENLKREGINPGSVHAANSGALAFSPAAAFNMVRVGLALYGYGPSPDSTEKLKPVMELRSRVTALRHIFKGDPVSYGRTWLAPSDCWIATLPIGYADGYQRILSNRSHVYIGGKRYPVAGRICMDQMMVNLGGDTKVKLYDTAILFGPDTDPASGIPDAYELAELADTIPYEITCGISCRVPRIFID